MQLFGLVNAMLSNDRSTAERDLSIARYAVIPLSPNSGSMLGHPRWIDCFVHTCLYQMIRKGWQNCSKYSWQLDLDVQTYNRSSL